MASSKTAEQLRSEAAAADQRAADSFERCDTDGFLSQWASGITAQEKRLQADIEDAGGVATFFRLGLETLDGQEVATKLISTRYGQAFALLDGEGNFTGEFVGRAKRASTYERKGYRVTRQEFVAKAKARIVGGGKGLAGATSCRVVTTTADAKVDYTGVVGLGDCTEGGE